MSKKLSVNEWIERAKKIHGDKYDYSKVEYKNAHEKVCIICPEHGEFEQVAYRHLGGNGCPKCAIEKRNNSIKKKKTIEDFILESKAKYGDKYDYSKVEYINAHTKVIIINKESGKEFNITPTTFLTKGIGDRGWMSTEKFIDKAKSIHGDKYDYSITKYVHPRKKIQYICPVHGIITQLPSNHLKYGCAKCSYEQAGEKRTKTQDVFINDAIKTHGDKYDYSKVEYKNNKTKVCIICPKHGEFWQSPIKHINGQGCPKCQNSMLEEEVMNYLNSHNITYIFQYDPTFLKNGKGKQRLDFYLPEYNVAIECQGIQHFVPTKYHSSSEVEKNKKRDVMKFEKCTRNNIQVLYYTTKKNFCFKDECSIYNDNNIFTDINTMFKNIIKK